MKDKNHYKQIIACSNSISDYGNLLVIGGVVPVEFTKSSIPKVNLKAIQGEEKGKKVFVDIVIDSVSQHPAVKVYEKDNFVKVQVQNTLVLSAYQKDEDTVVIEQLDLSPIGFNITGNPGGLSMGGMMLSGNAVHGGGALLGA